MSNPVPNFRLQDPELAEKIEVGDLVRSYDFEFSDDCYLEGTVIGLIDFEGCPRYRIAAVFKVWEGEQKMIEREIIPPVNGTPRMMGGYCNGVRKVTP